VQQNGIIVCLLRYRVFFADLVKVGFMFRISSLFLGDTRVLHHLAKMRESSEEHLMVEGVTITSLSDSTETPAIGLANERGKLGVLKVGRDHTNFKLARLQFTFYNM
jgi:hypothetical protein